MKSNPSVIYITDSMQFQKYGLFETAASRPTSLTGETFSQSIIAFAALAKDWSTAWDSSRFK